LVKGSQQYIEIKNEDHENNDKAKEFLKGYQSRDKSNTNTCKEN
jgi:hypothetical protein